MALGQVTYCKNISSVNPGHADISCLILYPPSHQPPTCSALFIYVEGRGTSQHNFMAQL